MKLWTEVGIGFGLAVVVYLLFRGINLLPIVILAGILIFLLRTTGLQALNRRFAVVKAGELSSRVTFDDVGGQQTAKQELVEALDFMIHEDRVKELGIRPLKGVLLQGPPGTGKTLLAKAAAHYTDSVFFACSGSEFVEMYAGVGAQRVRELFRNAREQAMKMEKNRALIFIDEIEVLGGKRGQHTSHLEYDQTLNQLLVELDGMKSDDSVRILVMAATNRADLLDDALLRPGRFDRIVQVDLPDKAGRLQILKLHTRNKPLADDVDLEEIARETFGFSGAHLESLANEAAILAMRQGKREISASHFREAVDKVILGEKMDRTPTEEDRRRIAVHEAGHAVVGEFVRPGSVASITITSRGRALGYVRQAPDDDRYLYTEEALQAEISRCLAGTVAEELVLGSASTGAAGDFQQAVQLAQKIILAGMSRIGIIHEDTIPQEQLHEVQTEILNEAREQVRNMLQDHIDVLEHVADRLQVEETLSGDELRELMAQMIESREAVTQVAVTAVND